MSDTEHNDAGEHIENKVTPSSQKSALDQVREAVAGLYDRAAAAVQPNESKSTTEGVNDDTTDKASEEGKEAEDAEKDSHDENDQSSSDNPSDGQ